MSRAVVVLHGQFGRATLYSLNKPMATHAHREAHLIFLVQGPPATVTVSGQARAVTPGQAVAVNPWQPHSFEPGDLHHGSLFLIFYIKPIWFLECGRSAESALRFGRTEIAVSGQIPRLLSLSSTLLLEAETNDLFDGYLFELSRECFHQSWQWTDGRTPAPINQLWPAVRDYRIRNSIELMSRRVGDALVLDEIAREAGLSRPHFYKLFREHVGLTPNIYLNTLKMEASIDRLTQSSDLVTDIALDLGFSSQASFTRFFSTNVGIPPTDYRRVTQMRR
jgi:AraC-like DNA-binding protein